MDPTEALRLLCRAIIMNEREDALEHCQNLQDWLSSGGFPPQNVTGLQLLILLQSVETALGEDES